MKAGSADVILHTTTAAMGHAAVALRTFAVAQTAELVDEAYVAALKISLN